MEIAFYEIEIEAVGFLFSPGLIVATAVVWLLLATGTVGRVARYFEELPHRRAAKAILGSLAHR